MAQHADYPATLFQEDRLVDFDFSASPGLVRLRQTKPESSAVFENQAMSRWAKAQKLFMSSTKDKMVFTRDYVERGKRAYDLFFQNAGPLRGRVLDIGGGWGLFRQWWEPGNSGFFLVHDPGVERFVNGPHALHREYFAKAFSHAMTFVEGFGEDLPYQESLFDTCLIAGALDHCIDPGKVIGEAHRCLKPGGAIRIIQSCHACGAAMARLNALKVLLGYARHPVRAAIGVYKRLLYREHHMHHFAQADLISLLENAGFSGISCSSIPNMPTNFAFTGTKEI